MKVVFKQKVDSAYKIRHVVLLSLLLLLFVGVIARLLDIVVFDRGFLLHQGEQRILHKSIIFANRGKILDVNGSPLAISTAMYSLWIDPKSFKINAHQKKKLARFIKKSNKWVEARVNAKKRFVYLKRYMNKFEYEKVKSLNIKGLHVMEEYKRHYPLGPVISQLIGFTNINDRGQEGLELALDYWLHGENGAKLVETDLYGGIISEKKIVKKAIQGRDVSLTIDHRVQYIAYKYLKNVLLESGAKWGSVVVMQPFSGNVLAMVNLPALDPNLLKNRKSYKIKNRAVVDMFEPGSTVKPLVAVSLLENGFSAHSKVNVGSGSYTVKGHVIHDVSKNLGVIDLANVLKKSSNVGMAKFAMQISTEKLINNYKRFGFGRVTNSGFPGESFGILKNFVKKDSFDHAALGYGYGLAITNLQLAHAYSILANDGVDVGVNFIKNAKHINKRVVSHDINKKIVNLLHGVTAKDGSGRRARVKGVEVAGKTGTSLIASRNYARGFVNASFVGMAPVKKPKLVVSIVIGEPKAGWRYGGLVAAPVFSKIVGDSLVILRE